MIGPESAWKKFKGNRFDQVIGPIFRSTMQMPYFGLSLVGGISIYAIFKVMDLEKKDGKKARKYEEGKKLRTN